MDSIVRVDFEEIDQQWIVTLTGADGATQPGEPFPASGHENFSKLEQVLARLRQLGLRQKHTPYNKVNEARYSFEVEPI